METVSYLPQNWEQLDSIKQRGLYARLVFNHFAETQIDVSDPERFGTESNFERRSNCAREFGNHLLRGVRLSGGQGLSVYLTFDPDGEIQVASSCGIVDTQYICFRTQQSKVSIFAENIKYPITEVISNFSTFINSVETEISKCFRDMPLRQQQGATTSSTPVNSPSVRKPKYFRPKEHVGRLAIWAPTGVTVEDTPLGKAEVVYADVFLYDEHRPWIYRSQRILNARVVSELKKHIGDIFPSRLNQDYNNAGSPIVAIAPRAEHEWLTVARKAPTAHRVGQIIQLAEQGNASKTIVAELRQILHQKGDDACYAAGATV